MIKNLIDQSEMEIICEIELNELSEPINSEYRFTVVLKGSTVFLEVKWPQLTWGFWIQTFCSLVPSNTEIEWVWKH